LGALGWALWGAAAIGVAGVVYIIAQSATNPTAKAPGEGVPKVATGPEVATGVCVGALAMDWAMI